MSFSLAQFIQPAVYHQFLPEEILTRHLLPWHVLAPQVTRLCARYRLHQLARLYAPMMKKLDEEMARRARDSFLSTCTSREALDYIAKSLALGVDAAVGTDKTGMVTIDTETQAVIDVNVVVPTPAEHIVLKFDLKNL